MGDIRPWQLILIVIGLGGGITLVVWNMTHGGGPRPPSEVLLVDLKTGDRFVADTSGKKMLLLPERHPETGEPTLVPVREDENGRWAVTDTYLIDPDSVTEFDALVNASTGEINVSDAKPRTFKRIRPRG